MCRRRVAIERGLCRSVLGGSASGRVAGFATGYGKADVFDPPRRGVRRGGKEASLQHQEAVGGDGQGSVMVKTAPVAAFKMAQVKFLFEFLVITLDAPAQFGSGHQLAKAEGSRQIGEKVLSL